MFDVQTILSTCTVSNKDMGIQTTADQPVKVDVV